MRSCKVVSGWQQHKAGNTLMSTVAEVILSLPGEDTEDCMHTALQ
jgi:hypothetical protein